MMAFHTAAQMDAAMEAAAAAARHGEKAGNTAHAASRMDHARLARDSGVSMFGAGYRSTPGGAYGGDPWPALFGPMKLGPYPAAPGATRAWGEGSKTLIAFGDGSVMVRAQGSRAWRNNNPGNLRNSEFSQAHYSLGEAGGFAVFPDEGAGTSALLELLDTETYQGLTVNQAIARFAPAFENNTAGYQSGVQRVLGVPGNTPLSSMTTPQLDRLGDAIRGIEHWHPGSTGWR
jgi:hypothetical protein